MPRKKIYMEPRVKPSIRIPKELYEKAQERAATINLNFNTYLEKLIQDDLLLYEHEKREQCLRKLRRIDD